MPVDPYTEGSYFETVKKLEAIMRESGAEVGLMGAAPSYPATKYGYILPFEVISLLLLACIVGGILIARKR